MIYFPRHSLTEELNVLFSIETASCNSIRTRTWVKFIELQSWRNLRGRREGDQVTGRLDYFKYGMII